jgi:hypothetical protein
LRSEAFNPSRGFQAAKQLADALNQWAFCSLNGSPGARGCCRALRSRGVGRQAARRQFSNRLAASFTAA